MNFDESVNYLLSLGNEVSTMKLGLENIRKLLDALGCPEKNYLKIQIAGTNGKGSTAAFLEAICLSAKIRVGTTTSPHLVSVTERIRIVGREISEKNFAKLATKVRQTGEKLIEKGELETVPTYFEQVTAMALCAFADEKVELAILETGLGGRFDAATAANAEIAAITAIDYDHQQYLGETLTEIAAEKAAIIRRNSKVVIGRQKPEALKVILEHCKNLGVESIDDCRWTEENSDEVFFKTENELYAGNLNLSGDHQRDNACVAISLAEVLARNFDCKISRENVEKGLSAARHRGRLEFFGGILFDGAHNIAGAESLRNYLKKYHPKSKITMVFGAMRDKDLTEIAEILFPLAEDLILTEPDNPRSLNVAELEVYAEKVIGDSKIFLVPKAADALDSAIQINSTRPKTKNSFVCVTGSLYLVGEARKILKSYPKI